MVLVEVSGSLDCCCCEYCPPALVLLFLFCSVVVEPAGAVPVLQLSLSVRRDMEQEGGAEALGVLKPGEDPSASGAM